MSTSWRTRPVFISSTFRDMQAERDYLRDFIFPRIEEELRKRRHHLEPVDLRLGVETAQAGDEEARELLVLKVCLDEIKRSRPFLLVLLGDRYGCVPPSERIAAAAQEQGFATTVVGKSITALEIEFGLLKKDPEQRRRSLFFFRQPLPYDKIPPAMRADYSDALSADPQVRECHQRLTALKEKLRHDPELGPRVFHYSADWDVAAGRVTGLEAFGELVFQKLWNEIDEETTAFVNQPPPTWEDEERSALAEFVEHRSRCFVGRTALLDRLATLARSPATANQSSHPSPSPLWGACVTGPPGSGKSALFAQLYCELSKDDSLLLLANTAGGTLRGARVDAMLRRWIGELSRFLGLANPLSATPTPDEVDAAFHGLLNRGSSANRPVVLLLDALDQFEPTPRGQHLTWLKAGPPPANIRIFATALPGKAATALCDWPEIEAIELPPLTSADAAEIGRKVWECYHRKINPAVLRVLTEKKRTDGTFAAGNPLWLTLALEQLNLLDADDFSRAERDFRGSPTERMQALLLDTAERMPADVSGLYRWLFERIAKVFGPDRLRAFLAAITLSRNGWRESDLQILLPQLAKVSADGSNSSAASLVSEAAMKHAKGRHGPDDVAPNPSIAAPSLEVAALRRAFRFDLIFRNELQWDFFHREAREAARLFLNLRGETTMHACIAAFLIAQPNDDPVRCDEVTYHLLRAREFAWIQIFYGSTATTDPREIAAATATFVDEVNRAGVQWLKAISNSDVALQALDQHGVDQVSDLQKKDIRRDVATGWCTRCMDELLPALASSVPLSDRRTLIEVLLSRLADSEKDFPDDQALQRLVAALREMGATLAVSQGDWAAARRDAAAALRTFAQLASSDPSDTQRILDFTNGLILQGDLAVQRGDYAAAQSAYQQACASSRHLSPENHGSFAVACDKLGDVARTQERFDAAREAYEQALPVFRELAARNPVNRRDLSLCLAKLGELAIAEEEPDRARELYEEHLSIAEQIAQADPDNAEQRRDLAGAHGRMMQLAQEAQDIPAAIRHAESVQGILEMLVKRDPTNASWVQDLAGSFYNLGRVVDLAGDTRRAAELFTASVKILRGLHAEGRLDAQGRRLMLSVATHVTESPDHEFAADAVCCALEIVEETDDKTARAFSIAALGMGSRLVDANCNAPAERVLQKTLPAAEAIFGAASRETAAALNLLGIVMKRKGDLVAAETLYRRAYLVARSLEKGESDLLRVLHCNLMWVQLRTRAVAVGEPEKDASIADRVEIQAHDAGILAVAICRRGDRFITGGADGCMKVWSSAQRTPVRTISAHKQAVTGLAMTEDGARVFSCSWDRTVKAWDVATGDLVAAADYPRADLCTVTSTPDGSTVYLAGEDGVVNRWRPDASAPITAIGSHRDVVMATATSDDGLRVISGSSDRTIRLWDLKCPDLSGSMQGHDGSVMAVAITRDGRTAVSGAKDGTMVLWDLSELEILRAFTAHTESLTALALSGDGRVAASGARDNTVKLWRLATGKLVVRFEFQSQVWAVAASADLSVLVIGERAGRLSVLRLDPHRLAPRLQ